jgi:amidase
MGWEEIAADKKKRIDESIPKEWRVEVKDQNGSFMDLPASSGLLSSDELEITNSSAVDLVAKLASGQLKSVDVTLAFCKRAALAHQAVGHSRRKQYDHDGLTRDQAEPRTGVLPRDGTGPSQGAGQVL